MRVRKGEEGNGWDQETYFQAIRNLHEPSFRVPSDPDTKQPQGHSHSETQAPGVQNMPDASVIASPGGLRRRNPVPPDKLPLRGPHHQAESFFWIIGGQGLRSPIGRNPIRDDVIYLNVLIGMSPMLYRLSYNEPIPHPENTALQATLFRKMVPDVIAWYSEALLCLQTYLA